MMPQKPQQSQQVQQSQPNNNADMIRLVRRGLLPAKDLPLLKAAMKAQSRVGDIAKVSPSHRNVLSRYNNALATAAYASKQSVQALTRNLQNGYEVTRNDYISERVAMATDPPMMLILKRRAIRIFPDGKRVALYNNERLGLSFTVPYDSVGFYQSPQGIKVEDVDAEEIMENLDQVIAFAQKGDGVSSATKHFKFADGNKLKVSHGAAKAIHMVHNALNDENKKKFAEMLKTPKGFEKAAHFALNRVQFTIGGK